MLVERLKHNDELLSVRYFNNYADALLKLESPYFDDDAVMALLKHHIGMIEEGNERMEKTIDSATRAFSSIVTKLQYQDIISQSIQHILSSHLDIIEKTSTYEQLSGDEIDEILKKIKFMTLLQASQLIQVNKDYQDSIKVIVEKFESLSSNIQGLVELSDLLKSKNHLNESFWIDIVPPVSSFIQIINLSINSLGRFKEASLLLAQDIETIKGLSIIVRSIKSQVEKLYDTFYQEKDATGNENELLKILLKDINTEVAEIGIIVSDINDNTTQTVSSILQIKKLERLNNCMFNVYSTLNKQLNSIELFNQKMKQNLCENSDKGVEIAQDLKNSIHEIKYYTQFEKTAETIIYELEHLKSEILFDEADFSEINTESFKKLYTVKAEHDVLNNLVNKTDKPSEEDEGEIEFF